LATYLIREYRVLAYSQFLEAYKSVMLSSMASSFGISVELLDAELSRFISAGRLNAKIDKVGDIVETRRPDHKNTQYHEVIKKGDLLLNSIQKLVRAIDV
jgi:26S proteasome regulatory subunit N7